MNKTTVFIQFKPLIQRMHSRAAQRRQLGATWLQVLLFILSLPVLAIICAFCVLALAAILANDRLPSMDSLVAYHPKVPLRVYTADNILIGEFGEERRSVVKYKDVPDILKKAVLSVEDSRFFEHSGIDPLGVARAAISNLTSGGKGQGASTITMQLARNFFLSREKTYTRKIYEILLALRIEQTLSKEQIFEIYLNQIYLGQRSYGFESAAQTYFGKTLKDLSIAESAMLAGLPQAPGLYNPVLNRERAVKRQHSILNKMHGFKFITDEQLKTALAQELDVKTESSAFLVQAPYVAELARQLAYDQFKEETYTAGLSVYTTISAEEQITANAALKAGVLEYDRKYGFRGPEEFFELPKQGNLEEIIEDKLSEYPDVDDYQAAVVISVNSKSIKASRGRGGALEVTGDGLRFVASAIGSGASAERRIKPGAIIRVVKNARDQWEMVQLPEVESAFIAINTTDGAVRALVGGFNFSRNKFNRVTQAWRQPGSTFKPFIYSAALEKGFMTSTLINDAPVIIDSAQTGGQLWEPKNYDGRFEGAMTMRTGLAKSKNMVSIRLLQAISPQYAQDYITRFGFDRDKHPAFLTMALGAGAVTPWQMASGISVFANGGYRVEPYLVTKIIDSQGKILAQAQPIKAGNEGARVIDPRNAYIVDSMLRTVVSKGTADKAKALKRGDVAGKTGTTNDSHDAWFAGYAGKVAAIAWMGFDQPRKLGERETGGGLALPIWLKYMQKTLKGVPETTREVPSGISQQGGEVYYQETRPGTGIAGLGVEEIRTERTEEVRDQIF